MLQEGFFRPAGMVGDMPAKIFADLRLVGPGLSENRIDNLGHLPAQGAEVLPGLMQLGEVREGVRSLSLGRRNSSTWASVDGIDGGVEGLSSFDFSRCGIVRSSVLQYL